MGWEYFAIPLAAFGASLLTFFSGFGLGTILTPVFAIFFPVEFAIAMTAVVHFLNNIFKFLLIGRNTQKSIFLKFGVPGFVGAIVGGWLLVNILGNSPEYQIHLFSYTFSTNLLKIVIGILIILFSLLELVPALRNLTFSQNLIIPGGLVSGFFGGVSGHQGALRSAFLIKYGLTKEQFIATGIAISLAVDVARISMYGQGLLSPILEVKEVAGLAMLAAFAGAMLGRRMLKKVELQAIELLVGSFLLLMGVLIAVGIV